MLSALSKELQISEYFDNPSDFEPETPEFLLPRSLEMKAGRGLREGKCAYPRVVPSPDGSLVARAGVFARNDVLKRQSEKGEWFDTREVEARIDAFRLASREQVLVNFPPLGGAWTSANKPFRPRGIPSLPNRTLGISAGAPMVATSAMASTRRASTRGCLTGSALRKRGQVLGKPVDGEWSAASVIVDAGHWYKPDRSVRPLAWAYFYLPGAFNASRDLCRPVRTASVSYFRDPPQMVYSLSRLCPSSRSHSLPSGTSVSVKKGVTLVEAAAAAGSTLAAPCGGVGRCGKCAARVRESGGLETGGTGRGFAAVRRGGVGGGVAAGLSDAGGGGV